jgi:hypothetical protein
MLRSRFCRTSPSGRSLERCSVNAGTPNFDCADMLASSGAVPNAGVVESVKSSSAPERHYVVSYGLKSWNPVELRTVHSSGQKLLVWIRANIRPELCVLRIPISAQVSLSHRFIGDTHGEASRVGDRKRAESFAGLCRSRSNSMSDLVEEEIANFKVRRFHFRALPFLKTSNFRFCIFPLSNVGPQNRGCGWGYARRCCIPMSSSDQPLRADAAGVKSPCS